MQGFRGQIEPMTEAFLNLWRDDGEARQSFERDFDAESSIARVSVRVPKFETDVFPGVFECLWVP
jgi:hypothetical protein